MIARIDDAGGMYQAVEAGLVQKMIGESALAFQDKVDPGRADHRRCQQVPVSEESELPRAAAAPAAGTGRSRRRWSA